MKNECEWQMRVADAVFERLKQETDTVYFVSGGGAMFLCDALGRSGLNHVAMIHEAGAGFAALGHAMLTNRLGVCLVTSGPGATNAITACAAAWMDSVPVLFLSGQAKTETLVGDTRLRTRGVQEVDIIPMVAPITKFAFQISGELVEAAASVDQLVRVTLDHMIKLCLSGRRGPCWLSVPLDVQGMELL
jgi:acetolactate synthase I/II/III large subunit